MKSRSLNKLGHRRQISKEMIKMNLLSDMYPIPRRNSSKRNRSARQTATKIRNILDFLQYSHSQELLLSLFQQKIALELTITPYCIETILKEVRAQGQVINLVTKLACSQDISGKDTIFLLRGLISTTYKEVRQLIELFFFFYFIKCHQQQYRTLMREFENKNIFAAVCKSKSANSELLTSKILSILAMVYVKYGEKGKFNKIAEEVIQLRREIQGNFFNKPQFNIDEDYVSTTFYLSMKNIETILSTPACDNYDVIQKIKKQTEIIKESYDMDQITTSTKDIFISQMGKYKQMAISQLENNYFNENYDYEPPEKKKERARSALKEYRQKRQSKYMTAIKHGGGKSDILQNSQKQIAAYMESKSVENRQRKVSIEQPSRNFRQVYKTNSSNNQLSSFSKIGSDSTIKKTKKTGKVQFQNQKSSTLLSKYPNLFTKMAKPSQQEEEKKKLEKKIKIGQIYKTFSNQNKIHRDIPSKHLKLELFNIITFEMGNKSAVREMYKNQIVQFSAGLQKGYTEFQNILTVKSCLELEFVKLWIGQPLFCRVKIDLRQTAFQVEVTINGVKNTVILHRGKNMLCERYLTIWPTIRYLIHKKIAQLTIFRHYESELIQRKVFEVQLSSLCNEYYAQKFGAISREEIEEVNICLDNLIKLVLVLQHYQKRNSTRYELGKEYRYKIQDFDLQDGEMMKLNMLSQIYLNEYSKIQLCKFMVCSNGTFYFLKLQTARQKILKTINQKENIEIEMSVKNIDKIQVVHGKIFVLDWKQLERSLVFYEDFVQFFKARCSDIKTNHNFVNRLTDFVARRLYISDPAIFKAEVEYRPVANISYMMKYQPRYKELLKEYPLYIFTQFKLSIIENQLSLEPIRYSIVLVKQKNLKYHRKTRPVRTVERSSRMGAHIEKLTSPLTSKRKKSDSNIKHWREERKINNNKYLILVTLVQFNQEEFQVEYSLINRTNESKDVLKINHLDIEILYNRHFLSPKTDICIENVSSYDILACSAKEVQEINQDLALDVLNRLDFYHNHHVRKLYIESQNGLYSHCFKEKRKLEIEQVKRMSKMTQIEKLPYLSRFEFGCKKRISRVIKIGNRYGILTFKRILISNQAFWEVILEFARNHIALVCQLEEQDLTYLLSDHSLKNIKVSQSLAPSGIFLLSSVSSIPRYSKFNPDSLNISMESKHEEYIDYRERILGCFERKQIQVSEKNDETILHIKMRSFPLKQRIIAQWDHEHKIYYSVWLKDEQIQVKAQYSKEDLDLSISSNQNSSSLKQIVSETLGQDLFSYAQRFYEMENKETEDDTFEKKRVCLFYLESCKHQRYKYKYPHS